MLRTRSLRQTRSRDRATANYRGRQATRKHRCQMRTESARRGHMWTYISIAFWPSLMSARAVNPGGPTATKAPLAWCPSRNPVWSGKGVLLDGRGRVAETVARRKRYQGEPGSGGTYRHNPICDAHDAKTSSAIGHLPRAARVRDSDSPDDVDANVKEGHEKP